MPYCNGFRDHRAKVSDPTTYRYALAEQLDLTSRKWAAVDSFIYLCKLHGSINWIEEGGSLFPIREVPAVPANVDSRVMIYPTPMKQNASFGSPYSDMFREFQGRIVRDQSVLFVIGYSFSDEHVNNLIFQANHDTDVPPGGVPAARRRRGSGKASFIARPPHLADRWRWPKSGDKGALLRYLR